MKNLIKPLILAGMLFITSGLFAQESLTFDVGINTGIVNVDLEQGQNSAIIDVHVTDITGSILGNLLSIEPVIETTGDAQIINVNKNPDDPDDLLQFQLRVNNANERFYINLKAILDTPVLPVNITVPLGVILIIPN
jgi:hypothetical protein